MLVRLMGESVMGMVILCLKSLVEMLRFLIFLSMCWCNLILERLEMLWLSVYLVFVLLLM